MKLRIQGNSIRLRLSQSEVQEFGERGFVHETTNFSDMASDTLYYSLESCDADTLGASYESNQIRIFVPRQMGKDWANSDQVGMDYQVKFAGEKPFRILVEKDFQCLTPRPGEDESDNFPNPNQNC